MKQNTVLNALIGFVLCMACIITVLLLSGCSLPSSIPQVMGTVPAFRPGGDCQAQLATGDTYLGEVDESCVTHIWRGAGETPRAYSPVVAPTRINVESAVPAVVVTVMPTNNVIVTPMPTDAPSTPEPTVPAQKQKKDKHPNKGEGNGGEDADPGNHPEKGNDDEDGGKEKKDK